MESLPPAPLPPPPSALGATAGQPGADPTNTSGGGKDTFVPEDARRWNWGAFLLSWIWGIGNRTYIAFLAFVPVIGLVMPFVLGAKGSRWAWQNKRWESLEHFRRVQRRWAWGGLASLAAVLAFVGIGLAVVAGDYSTLAPPTTGSPRPLPADWRLLSRPDDGYAIGVPRDWKESRTEDGDLEATPPRPGAALIVAIEPLPFTMGLGDYADASVDGIERELGTKEVSRQRVRLPAGPAEVLRYRNEGVAIIQYLLATEESGYIISFFSVPLRQSENEPIFRQIAESFRLVARATAGG